MNDPVPALHAHRSVDHPAPLQTDGYLERAKPASLPAGAVALRRSTRTSPAASEPVRGCSIRAGLKAHVCLPGSASPPACRGSASPPACRAQPHPLPAGALLHLLPAGLSLTPCLPGACFTSCLPGACFTSCLPGSASPPACRGSASPPACRAQPHPLPAGALLHLLPAGALLHLLPAGGLLHLLPAGGLLHLLPAGAVALTAPTAGLSRSACQTGRSSQPSPPDARTPANVAPLIGQKKTRHLPTATRPKPDRLDNPNRPVSILSNSKPALCALAPARTHQAPPVPVPSPGFARTCRRARVAAATLKPARRTLRHAVFPGRNHQDGDPPPLHAFRHFLPLPARSPAHRFNGLSTGDHSGYLSHTRRRIRTSKATVASGSRRCHDARHHVETMAMATGRGRGGVVAFRLQVRGRRPCRGCCTARPPCGRRQSAGVGRIPRSGGDCVGLQTRPGLRRRIRLCAVGAHQEHGPVQELDGLCTVGALSRTLVHRQDQGARSAGRWRAVYDELGMRHDRRGQVRLRRRGLRAGG
jgi:hypothetical protein